MLKSAAIAGWYLSHRLITYLISIIINNFLRIIWIKSASPDFNHIVTALFQIQCSVQSQKSLCFWVVCLILLNMITKGTPWWKFFNSGRNIHSRMSWLDDLVVKGRGHCDLSDFFLKDRNQEFVEHCIPPQVFWVYLLT